LVEVLAMSGRTLMDAQWERIAPRLLGKAGGGGRTAVDTRWFADAVLWLARTASRWRDLPPELGDWRTVRCRFRRWTHAGVWERLIEAMRVDPDFEYVLGDATICKAHADASAAKGGSSSRDRPLPRGADDEGPRRGGRRTIVRHRSEDDGERAARPPRRTAGAMGVEGAVAPVGPRKPRNARRRGRCSKD
jgi:putative transposase